MNTWILVHGYWCLAMGGLAIGWEVQIVNVYSGKEPAIAVWFP